MLALVLLGVAILAWGYAGAVQAPVVVRSVVGLPGLDRAVRAVLVSDIHVAGPDMPPARLAQIVAQVNALDPDIVLIAGDMISEKRVATRIYSMAAAIAPLSGLEAPLGTFAVLGNHDHWFDAEAARVALGRAGVKLIENGAVAAGPLAIGGLDDAFTGRHDLPAVVGALARTPGVPVLLSHSPDPFPDLPPHIPLMLAGHTHCGQIRLPLLGAISTMSEHGERYACGVVREKGRTLIVSAGLGTSLLPLRYGTAPEIRLVELVPL